MQIVDADFQKWMFFVVMVVIFMVVMAGTNDGDHDRPA